MEKESDKIEAYKHRHSTGLICSEELMLRRLNRYFANVLMDSQQSTPPNHPLTDSLASLRTRKDFRT
jgi:hypothetical protein